MSRPHEDFIEWIKQYKPLLDKSGDPRLFEDFDGLDFQPTPDCIWTDQDDNEGNECVRNGVWHSNRLGYYICEIPCTEESGMVAIHMYDDLEELTDEEFEEKYLIGKKEWEEKYPHHSAPY